MKKILLFLGLCFLTISAFAGGSIFSHHKSRVSNPNGVSSIGIHICGSLNCPGVILKKGNCGTVANATTKYGVCVCDDGYKANGATCVKDVCPNGQYKVNKECHECPENASCQEDVVTCSSGYYLKPQDCTTTPCSLAECLACPPNAKECNAAGIPTECKSGYKIQGEECVVDTSICDISEKVEKVYYQGACCTSPVYGLFCPGEAVPTCEPMDEAACAATDESTCTSAGGTWVFGWMLSGCAPVGSKTLSSDYMTAICRPDETPDCSGMGCVCKSSTDSAGCFDVDCRVCAFGESHCGQLGCICTYPGENKDWACGSNTCLKCGVGEQVVTNDDQTELTCIASDENAIWNENGGGWCICKNSEGQAYNNEGECVCGNTDTCFTDAHCGEGGYCLSDHTCHDSMQGAPCSIDPSMDPNVSNCSGDAPYCDITTNQCTSEPKQYCFIASGVGGCTGSTPWCHYYDGFLGICTNEVLGAQCRVDDGLTCPDGYYCTVGPNEDACQPCPDGAATCENETGTPITCAEGYTLDGTSCIAAPASCTVGSTVEGCNSLAPYCHVTGGDSGYCDNNPAGASCAGGQVCGNGYYCTDTILGTCQPCLDANALTCDYYTGASTSCAGGYRVDNGVCIDENSCNIASGYFGNYPECSYCNGYIATSGCQSCDDPTDDYSITEAECTRVCTNRKYVGGHCGLKNTYDNYNGRSCTFEGGYCYTQDGTKYTTFGCLSGHLTYSNDCDSAFSDCSALIHSVSGSCSLLHYGIDY